MPVPGALKLWMGAVRMGGVLWVAVLKRDPHVPGGPVRKGCLALQSGEAYFSIEEPHFNILYLQLDK